MLQEGKLSTGNSLDMTLQDEEYIKANDATVKDMEVSRHLLAYLLICSSEICFVSFNHKLLVFASGL